jgi:hypothetical protein
VQHENRFLELDGVDGSVRSTRVVFDHFQYSRAPETFQHLCGVVLFAVLGKVQGVTEELPYANRQRHQVLFAASNPYQRFFGGKHKLIIPEKV